MRQHDAAGRVKQPRQAKRGRPVAAAQHAGWLLRQRRDLLASTALGASAMLLLAFPAAAQPAPTARPQGGTVVAGSASISQTTAQTNVAQSSQRAAVDWRSFDVGSSHTVTFQQPNASSVTLNRVTGPDPSQIAGRIQANGQVVLVNGSGVVFHAGSQVDAQSLVVSAANVTNSNFMAGRMVFDQPGRADARISNAGTITVGATGLAALVAPQVANAGVINARMGHVVLAGAEAHTVDLYGDGLMSVDVTRQVTRTPGGGRALVTNTGTIQADGGTIQLTAQAADGIVQNLVSAGGRLQANTAGGKPGTIVVSGIGGSITVEGAVRADGRAPGAGGGTVVLAATDTVNVGPAARVSANGQGGGGTIAVGTTAARARAQSGGVPDSSARAVLVAAGAHISADGRGTGSGGQIAILSTQRTAVAGRLTARGGARGGNGGQVEISGAGGLQITGTVDTSAPAGRIGTLTIDPTNLVIGESTTAPSLPINPLTMTNTGFPYDQTPTQYISTNTFNGFITDVKLTATDSIKLIGGAGVTLAPVGGGQLHAVTLSATGSTGMVIVDATLQAQAVTINGVTINITAPVTSASSMTLAATGPGGTVSLGMGGNVNAATSMLLSGGTLNLGANVQAGTSLALSGGAANQTAGAITTPILTGSVTGATLLGTGNIIGALDSFSAPGGTVSLATKGSMTLSGAVSAGTLDIRTTADAVHGLGDVAQTGGSLSAGTLQGTIAGAFSASQSGNSIQTLGGITTGGSLVLATTGPLTLSGAVSANASGLSLRVTGGGLKQAAGSTITAGSLDVSTTDVTTLNGANAVNILGAVSTNGNLFSFTTNGPLLLAEQVNVGAAGPVVLRVTGGGLTQAAKSTITASRLDVSTTDVTTLNSANAVTTLGAVTTNGNLFSFTTGGPLMLADQVNTGAGPVSLRVTGGGLTQAAGSTITAGRLDVSTTDVTTLNGANAVNVLGAASTNGNLFGFTTNGPLLLADQVNVGAAGPVVLRVTGGGLTQAAGSTITAGRLDVSTTDVTTLNSANAVTTLGAVTTNGNLFSFTTGGPLMLADQVNTGAGPVSLRVTGGGLTQAAGSSITAGSLTGMVDTGSAALTSATNQIASLSTFATATGFRLVNGPTLIAGTVSATTGAVSLQAPTITAGGGTLSAPRIELQADRITPSATLIGPAAQLVAIAPRTPGEAMQVADTLPAAYTGLALTNAQLQMLAPATVQTVQLGSIEAVPTSGGSASGISLSGTASLAGVGRQLKLYAMGNIAQDTTGALTVGTVGGTSFGGSFLLEGNTTAAAPFGTGNAFSVLGPVIAAGSIAVASSTDLSVAATPVAGTGGSIALTSKGTLGLNAAIGTGTETLLLRGGAGITQSQPFNVASLAGQAGGIGAPGGDAVLNQAGNQVGLLRSFSAPGGNLTIFAQSVTLAAGEAVTGRNVSLRSVAGAMALNGAVGACAVDAASGTVTLAAPGAITVAGQVGGERSVQVLPGSGDVTVTGTGLLDAGRSGGIPLAGTLSIGGVLNVAGGTVLAGTISAGGGVVQTGGTLAASSILSTPAYAYNGGFLAAGNSITVSAGSIAAADTILSGGTVAINGTAPQFDFRGTVVARGAVTVTSSGSFTQAGGRIAAGGDVTVSTGGLAVQAGAGTIAAGGNITLAGGGAGLATLDGVLAAGGNLSVSEPNASVRFNPLSLNGTAPAATGPIVTTTLHCPSCDLLAPGATAAPENGAAVGPTGAQTVRIDGAAIELARSFGTGALSLNSTGDTIQTASVSASVITGRAGYTAGGTLNPAGGSVILTDAGNQIGGIGAYNVGGILQLVTGSPVLNVAGQVAVGGQTAALTAPAIAFVAGGSLRFGTVSGGVVTALAPAAAAGSVAQIRTDSLFLQSGLTNIDAPGGTVAIATLTAGRAITVDAATSSGSTLSLSAPGLAGVNVLGGPAYATAGGPQELRLGSLSDSLATGNAASSITINAPLTLTNSAATLRLVSAGNVGESGTGAVLIGRADTPGRVTGQAGGTVGLDAAGNNFDVLGNFQAGAGLRVATAAGPAGGRGGLLVAGTVSSGTGDLTLASTGLAAGGTAVGGTLQFGTTATQAVLNAGGGTLSLAVSGGSGTAPAIQQVNAALTAGTLTGSATNPVGGTGYNVVLDGGAANSIGTLGAFTVGTGSGPATPAGGFRLSALAQSNLVVAGPVTAGAVSITGQGLQVPGTIGGTAISLVATTGGLSSTGTIGGQASVQLSAPSQVLVSAGSVSAPTVTVASGLGITGGQVFGDTVTVTGGPTAMIGGVLHAQTLQAGTVGFSNGDLYAGNALSVSLAGVTAGQVATRGDLTVSAGSLSTTTTFRAGGGIALAASGDVQVAGGGLAAGGNVTVTAGGSVGQAASTVIAAGGTLSLQGAGTADKTLAGTLLGSQVQIVQPGANLALDQATMGGAATTTVGTLSNTYASPGLNAAAPASTYAATLTPGSGRATGIRVDGQALTLGNVSADQVVLHSGGSTTASGLLTAGTLSGTAGYAPSGLDAAGLPAYPLTAATAGTGSATFTAANVQRLGDYQVRSGFSLVDAPDAAGLTIAGTVRAGLASDPLTAPSASAAPVSITLTGAAGPLQIGDAAFPNAVLAGSTVTLATPGPITETPGSRIVANQFSATGSTLTLQGSNSIASLGAISVSSGITVNNPGASLTLTAPLNAGTGTLTLIVASVQQTAAGVVTAGTLTGSSTGLTDLTGAVNAIATLGGYTAAGGFALNDGATALQVNGPLNAGTSKVTLMAGSVQQAPAGIITAGTLSGSTAGIADLGGAVNAVAALGGFNAGGSFTLNDGQAALALTGPLMAGGTGATLTAGTLRQTAGGAITATQLQVNVPGATDLTAATNAVQVLGTVNGIGNFGLNDGTTSLTLSGPVNIGANTLTLQAGNLSQTAQGVITAGVLTGGTAGATNLGAVSNSIGSLGAYTSGGAFALSTGSNSLVLAGPLNAGGNQVTLTTGGLQQLAGAPITAGVLAGTFNGPANLVAANAVQALGAITVRGAFTFNGGTSPLLLAGPLNAGGNVVTLSAASLGQTASGTLTAGQLSGNIAGTTDLSTTTNTIGVLTNLFGGGDVRVNNGSTNLVLGTVGVGQNTLFLQAGVLTEQAGATLVAGTLSGSTRGAATLVSTGNSIGQLGAFTAGGGLQLAVGPDLSVTGAVQAGQQAITVSTGGSLTLQSGGSLAGGTVTLSGINIVERGGTISAGALTAAAGRIDLGSAGNAIQVLGTVTAPDGIRLQNGRSLTTLGAIRSEAGPVNLSVSGDLTVNAAVAASTAVILQSNGQMVQAPTSAVSGATVSITAGGPAVLAGTVAGGPVTVQANGLQVLGSITGGTVGLDGGTGGFGLLASGKVSGASITVTATGPAMLDGQVSGSGPVTVRSSGITLNGSLLTSGPIGLNAGGGDLASAGVLGTAGTITMQSGGAVRLSGRTAAGGSLLVNAGTTAALSGSESAQLLSVAAPTVRLDGGTILAGGGTQPASTRQAALPTASTAGGGAFFQAGSSFAQTGTTMIAGLTGTGGTTVRVSLAGNGTVTLGTLNAPASTLVLDLAGGSATGGPFQIGSLYLAYNPGGAGSADLRGQIGGQDGSSAASAATVYPFANRSFRINSCAGASVNCVILTPQTVPVGNPLKELSLSFFREQDDDGLLVVPNVTDQGL